MKRSEKKVPEGGGSHTEGSDPKVLSLVQGMERRPVSDDCRFRDGVCSKIFGGECVKGLVGELE